jgi:choline dehydrogenase-like flavoprotein
MNIRFQNEKTDSGLAMKNGQVYLPRGKVLGGTSMLNWMNYVRGNSR